MAPKRPILRYHGGKWLLAPWIIRHLPPHRVYVEPFGGAGSVLLRKPRAYCERYNDLDGEIVNLFQVARDQGAELRRQIGMTPYARDEYRQSFNPHGDPMEQARRTIIRSFMGFGSNALCRGTKTGFRATSKRSHTTPSHDWANLPGALEAVMERLQGVVIENRDAQGVMADRDAPSTLHYLDPPYVAETRSTNGAGYTHEMTDDQHRELAGFVHDLQGAVVVSGYRCDLYSDLFDGWRRVDNKKESLWLSPKAELTELLGL